MCRLTRPFALAFANVPKEALTATANSFDLTSAYYVLTGAEAKASVKSTFESLIIDPKPGDLSMSRLKLP